MRTELRSILGSSGSVTVIPSSAVLSVEDTAPMPLMTKDRSSGALPDDGGSGPTLPNRSSGAKAISARPDPVRKTTSSATFLDERALPTRTPSPALVGFALVALGAVLVAAVVIHRSGSPGTDSDSTASGAGSPSASSASLNDADAAAPATAAPPTATPAGADAELASSAPEPSPSAGTAHPPHSTHGTAAPTGAPVAAVTTANTGASPHTTSGPTTFDLATASANPSVARADGASSTNVRNSLPSAHFTQCYREALKRVGHRLEGKMTVHLQMGADGHVTTALVSAPESLLQGMGGCITESFNQLPIPGVAATGGSADITILFVPE